MAALSQYTTPKMPPENPWIDRPQTPVQGEATATRPDANGPLNSGKGNRSARRPPSRRLVRHVLKARVEAVNALASFFDQLEREGGDKRVDSSLHLARLFGHVTDGESSEGAEKGWRYSKEVVGFLRQRGAKIPTLGNEVINGAWAALSSEGEGYTTSEERDERVWVT
jgi:glycerol-3-phosphate O-acyltransferase/dihydroxyacetone phosphate acyltransferase